MRDADTLANLMTAQDNCIKRDAYISANPVTALDIYTLPARIVNTIKSRIPVPAITTDCLSGARPEHVNKALDSRASLRWNAPCRDVARRTHAPPISVAQQFTRIPGNDGRGFTMAHRDHSDAVNINTSNDRQPVFQPWMQGRILPLFSQKCVRV